MKSDRDKAIIMMRRKGSGLFPVSSFDDEALQQLDAGKDVEVSFKQRRSLPQLRRYWAMLGDVVAATDAYPNAERLHEALKFSMGYTAQIKTLAGQTIIIPDSVAFSRMGADEFRGFFDRAVRLIAETYGIDALALGEMAA